MSDKHQQPIYLINLIIIHLSLTQKCCRLDHSYWSGTGSGPDRCAGEIVLNSVDKSVDIM